MAQRGRTPIRRLLAAAGALMAAAALVLLIAHGDGGGNVPQAGSRFGHDEGHAADRQVAPSPDPRQLGREVAGVIAAGFEGTRVPKRVPGAIYVTDANASPQGGLKPFLDRVRAAAR